MLLCSYYQSVLRKKSSMQVTVLGMTGTAVRQRELKISFEMISID